MQEAQQMFESKFILAILGIVVFTDNRVLLCISFYCHTFINDCIFKLSASIIYDNIAPCKAIVIFCVVVREIHA